MDKPEKIIPTHETGTAIDVEDSVSLESDEEAKQFFGKVKERLLNINGWHQLAGSLSADFTLTDSSGNAAERKPQKGDYFKIDIPGPGILTGEGYDWVQVEDVLDKNEEMGEHIAIRVRPARSPVNDNPDVAHFYTDEATSNFIVKREGKKITAGVYGRNEKPNLTAADSVVDKIRNVFVGSGAVSGFSKLQWKALVSGLLSKE